VKIIKPELVKNPGDFIDRFFTAKTKNIPIKQILQCYLYH
jgi:hypothetical protein